MELIKKVPYTPSSCIPETRVKEAGGYTVNRDVQCPPGSECLLQRALFLGILPVGTEVINCSLRNQINPAASS